MRLAPDCSCFTIGIRLKRNFLLTPGFHQRLRDKDKDGTFVNFEQRLLKIQEEEEKGLKEGSGG